MAEVTFEERMATLEHPHSPGDHADWALRLPCDPGRPPPSLAIAIVVPRPPRSSTPWQGWARRLHDLEALPLWGGARPAWVRALQRYLTLGAGWAAHSGHTGRFHTARASGSPAGPTRRSSPGGPFDSGGHLRPPISPAAPTAHRCVS